VIVCEQLRVLKRATADWSIPYEELNFGRLLGKGSQGEVYQAEWRFVPVQIYHVFDAAFHSLISM